MLHLTLFRSPLGWIAILAHQTTIHAISAPRRTRAEALQAAAAECHGLFGPPNDLSELAKKRLSDYFEEPLKASFDDLPLDWTRGTDFERAVWKSVKSIPVGETRTYSSIALELGHSHAGRAVGRSNGKNPWAIIIPCHRVIGTTGSLTGYAGGLETKARLLIGEGVPATLPQRRGEHSGRH